MSRDCPQLKMPRAPRRTDETGGVTSAVSWVTVGLRAQEDAGKRHFGSRCPFRAWTLKGYSRRDADNLDRSGVRDTAHTAASGALRAVPQDWPDMTSAGGVPRAPSGLQPVSVGWPERCVWARPSPPRPARAVMSPRADVAQQAADAGGGVFPGVAVFGAVEGNGAPWGRGQRGPHSRCRAPRYRSGRSGEPQRS